MSKRLHIDVAPMSIYPLMWRMSYWSWPDVIVFTRIQYLGSSLKFGNWEINCIDDRMWLMTAVNSELWVDSEWPFQPAHHSALWLPAPQSAAMYGDTPTHRSAPITQLSACFSQISTPLTCSEQVLIYRLVLVTVLFCIFSITCTSTCTVPSAQ